MRDEQLQPVYLRHELHGRLDLPGGILRRQLIIVVAGCMSGMSSGHNLGVSGFDELRPVRSGKILPSERSNTRSQLCVLPDWQIHLRSRANQQCHVRRVQHRQIRTATSGGRPLY